MQVGVLGLTLRYASSRPCRAPALPCSGALLLTLAPSAYVSPAGSYLYLYPYPYLYLYPYPCLYPYPYLYPNL